VFIYIYNVKKALHKGGGLTVKDTIIGSGPEPGLGKLVKILYEGFLPDGTLFDSKQSKRSPLSFRLGLREVVPGFDKGVQGMKVCFFQCVCVCFFFLI
jgi:FKBP-type peptidyl-prolyl cis-trans isomerase